MRTKRCLKKRKKNWARTILTLCRKWIETKNKEISLSQGMKLNPQWFLKNFQCKEGAHSNQSNENRSLCYPTWVSKTRVEEKCHLWVLHSASFLLSTSTSGNKKMRVKKKTLFWPCEWNGTNTMLVTADSITFENSTAFFSADTQLSEVLFEPLKMSWWRVVLMEIFDYPKY